MKMKLSALTLMSSLVLVIANYAALVNAPKVTVLCQPKIPSRLLEK